VRRLSLAAPHSARRTMDVVDSLARLVCRFSGGMREREAKLGTAACRWRPERTCALEPSLRNGEHSLLCNEEGTLMGKLSRSGLA
jgi:hypothetical protein